MLAQVFKIDGSYFIVQLENGLLERAYAKGSIKQRDKLYVGDYCQVKKDGDKVFVIEKILPRDNLLIRPYVANIKKAYIFLAMEPEADFYTIDKQLIALTRESIDVHLVVNKMDIEGSEELYNKVVDNFSHIAQIHKMSTYTKEGVEDLKKIMECGEVSCLIGQSGVGKSSFINSFGLSSRVGELSMKLKRGKNTTRQAEIFDISDINLKLIDTCGFSSFELNDVHERDLARYYPEFNLENDRCRFRDCSHINENDCAVKRQVYDFVEKNVKINIDRYIRYVKLYREIREKRLRNGY